MADPARWDVEGATPGVEHGTAGRADCSAERAGVIGIAEADAAGRHRVEMRRANSLCDRTVAAQHGRVALVVAPREQELRFDWQEGLRSASLNSDDLCQTLPGPSFEIIWITRPTLSART